jgi:long-subunit acyl-CoA synthetase (AMP-forming)
MAALKALGLHRGDRVAILAHNSALLELANERRHIRGLRK